MRANVVMGMILAAGSASAEPEPTGAVVDVAVGYGRSVWREFERRTRNGEAFDIRVAVGGRRKNLILSGELGLGGARVRRGGDGFALADLGIRVQQSEKSRLWFGGGLHLGLAAGERDNASTELAYERGIVVDGRVGVALLRDRCNVLHLFARISTGYFHNPKNDASANFLDGMFTGGLYLGYQRR